MDNRFPPLLTILSAILIALLACGGNELRAAESQSLMTDGASKLGWAFDNGQEFPGATGELLEIPDGPGGEPFLRLSADFSGGGIYVEMVRGVKAGPDGLIRMKVRSKQEAKLRVRLIDSTGQCHQGQPLVFATDGEPNDIESWQEINSRITRENAGRKKIYTVAIGNYRKLPDLVSFLDELSRENGGKFLGVSD